MSWMPRSGGSPSRSSSCKSSWKSRWRPKGKNYNTNPGGYIWPVDSRYITSTVGGRTSPGGIGSTNHKGTDIGRVGYTSPVYAAKAGTVIVATQYSSSYGNYVVISHGSGNTTLYAHMSRPQGQRGNCTSSRARPSASPAPRATPPALISILRWWKTAFW